MIFKSLIGAVFATLLSISGFTQVCGTDYFLEKEYRKDPSFQNVVEQNWILSDAPISQSQGARAVKTIPVVFHIFHDNGNGDISYEQIESAMDMINEDFRRTNSDASSTRAIFAPFAADSEVEFRLAKIDPNGQCTNGVVRINNPSASHNAGNNVKSLSYWPSNNYFNVWVVNDIESGGVNGIILGYAQFPGSGSWSTYGVVIRNDRVGTVGTASSQDRTLTHEIGHCLNLLHTFQSGCGNNCQSSGDRVCDTPPVDHSTQGCSSSQNQCSNDAVGSNAYSTNVVDQIENYMSYDDCQNMFSLGQKARMQGSLSSFSTLNQLTSATNLANTGALQSATGICQANFEVANQIVCEGESVTFFDQSYFNPQSFSWEFEGGSPNVSAFQNPLVTYSTPGTYKVTLTISDSTSATVSTTKTDYITVISSVGNTTPFLESFETPANLESMDWFAKPGLNTFEWLKSNSGGSTGSYALKANAFFQTGTIEIGSPAFDVSNIDTFEVEVTFKYAYAPLTSGGISYLRAFISSDCGITWKLKWITGGTSMATRSSMSSPYNTPQATDWSAQSFTVPSSELGDNLRIKFEFKSGSGNNLFIDDININGQLSSKVVLKSPSNGSTGLSASETLDWNASSLADNYTLQIDTSNQFNSPMLVQQQIQYISTNSQGIDTEYLTTGLANGMKYYWRVKSDNSGTPSIWSETWSFSVNVNGLGKDFAVSKDLKVTVFPNPAHDQVNIKIDVEKANELSIYIYDITGNLIHTVYSGLISNGEQNFQIDRTGWSNGIYLVQVKSGTAVITTRMIFN